MRPSVLMVSLAAVLLLASAAAAGTMLPCTSLSAATCGSGACPIGEACLATGDDVVQCGCFAASTTTTLSVTTTTATLSTLPPIPPGECACDVDAPPNFDRAIRASLDGEARTILFRGIGTSPGDKELAKVAKTFQKVGTLVRKARSAAMLAQVDQLAAPKQEAKAAKALARADKIATLLGERIATAAASGAIEPTAASVLLGIHGLLAADIGGVAVTSNCFDKLQPTCGTGTCTVGSCQAFGSLGACLCQ